MRGRLFALGLAALTLLALWIVWPAFEPGRIVNLDAPRHLLRAMVMREQFLPAGHVDGWSPWWYLGAQLFLFQSYGYFFAIGLAAWILDGAITLEQTFKVFYVLPIVALPAATAFLARRMGVSAAGALVSGLASLALGSSMGFGVAGVFGIGLLLQGVGIVGFALAFPVALDAVLEKGERIWKAVLALAALLLCHFISGAYALATLGIVAAMAALAGRELGPLLRYGAIAALVLLLAGHSLFPSLEWHELAGSAVGWGNDKDRWWRFLRGTLFGVRPLALAAIVAAVYSLALRKDRLALGAAVLFGTAFVAGTDRHAWEPDLVASLLDVVVRPRALPYACLFTAVFVGVAFDYASTVAGALARASRSPGRRAAVGAVLAAAVLWSTADPLVRHRASVRTEAIISERNREPYVRLVEWMRENVDTPAIVSVERRAFPPAMVGARSVISFLNMDTGVFTLGGDQAELTAMGRRLGRASFTAMGEHPARYAKMLRSFGVSHVVVTDSKVRRMLARASDYERVFDYDSSKTGGPFFATRVHGKTLRTPVGYSVFRLRGETPWLYGPKVRSTRFRFSPERMSWRVSVERSRQPRRVTAAVSWHPNWRAYVDGAPVEVEQARRGLVAFHVPAGEHRVELRFERGGRQRAYAAVSWLTLMAVLGAWARSRFGGRGDG